jgi:hypothetical protein
VIDGSSEDASFEFPAGITALASGGCAVTEYTKGLLRYVDTTGNVSTVAKVGHEPTKVGKPFLTGGVQGIAEHPDGGFVVCDQKNHVVAMASSDGKIKIIAGSGKKGTQSGGLMASEFSSPRAIAVDCVGRIVVSDGRSGDGLEKERLSALRVIDPVARSVRALEIVDSNGMQCSPDDISDIAIDRDGNIWVVTADAIYHITDTGLMPGFNGWSQQRWRPTRGCYWGQCPNHAKQAVRAILLICIRLSRSQEPESAALGSFAICRLSNTLWIKILSSLAIWELGDHLAQSQWGAAFELVFGQFDDDDDNTKGRRKKRKGLLGTIKGTWKKFGTRKSKMKNAIATLGDSFSSVPASPKGDNGKTWKSRFGSSKRKKAKEAKSKVEEPLFAPSPGGVIVDDEDADEDEQLF